MLFKEQHLPTQVFNVGVDSIFRDRTKFPSASEYVVMFDSVFQNVVHVELVFAIYEKTGTENYVNLHIEELSPNLIANSNFISGSFCQLPLVTNVNTYNTSLYKCIKTFEKPLAKLAKLHIKFIDSTGKIYPMRDHFLKFEVSCLRFNGKANEWSNNELFSQTVSVLQPAVPKTNNDNDKLDIKINVPDQYDLEILKIAFKSACNTLRSYKLSRNIYNMKYDELKTQFKILAQNIK